MDNKKYHNPSIYGYLLGISFITPPLVGYNLKSLYQPKNTVPWLSSSLRMIPNQLILRTVQLGIANEIKSKTNNNWLAFSSIGIMQGFVYGNCTTQWLKIMKFPVKTSPNMWVGVGYAAVRDTISQGIPFAVSGYGLPIFITASILSTVASQGLHNCQTIMQVKSYVGYREAFQKGWKRHNYHILYKGCEARLGMMLCVNLLNYFFLKDIWKK